MDSEPKESVGQRIYRLAEKRGLTPARLSKLSGVRDNYLSALKRNSHRKISYPMALKLAGPLKVTPEEILGYESRDQTTYNSLPDVIDQMRRRLELFDVIQIPLLGFVSGGPPWTPEDMPEEYLCVAKKLVEGLGKPYAVRLSGDSLEGYGIHDGEMVIVDRNADIKDGLIYIVQIGSEVTAKRIFRHKGQLKLVGSNIKFEIMEPQRVVSLGRVILAGGNWRRVQ